MPKKRSTPKNPRREGSAAGNPGEAADAGADAGADAASTQSSGEFNILEVVQSRIASEEDPKQQERLASYCAESGTMPKTNNMERKEKKNTTAYSSGSRVKKIPTPKNRTREAKQKQKQQAKDSGGKSEEFDVMDIVTARAKMAGEADNGSEEEKAEEELAAVETGTVIAAAPTALRREQNVVQETQPGAFADVPGESAALQRNNSLRFSLLGGGRDDQHTAAALPVLMEVPAAGVDTNANLNANAGLAEAQPVPDDEQGGGGLQAATEITPAQVEQRNLKRIIERQRRLMILLILVLILAIVLGLVFGLGLASSREDKGVSPAVLSTGVPTLSPTTIQHSATPSSLQDLFVESLPRDTQERTKTLSPQKDALDWLFKHPNKDSFSHKEMTQLFAMAAFRYAFQGEKWPAGELDSWLDYKTTDACDWFSFGAGFLIETAPGSIFGDHSCNRNGEITQIILDFRNILDEPLPAPSIPPEIALLTALEILLFRGINASLPDLLPPEMAQIFNLTTIDFDHVHGTIPSYLSTFSRVGELYLGGQSLTGSLPSGLSGMSSLTTLRVYGNLLTGSLPTDIGIFPALTDLLISGNLFTGTIPTEIGLSKSMKLVHLQENQITGRIPSEFGLVPSLNDYASAIALFQNLLTGQIPSELGLLIDAGFGFGSNALTGLVPPEIIRFGMNISDNPGLVGTIPDEMCEVYNTILNSLPCSSDMIRCDDALLWSFQSGYISSLRPEFTCTSLLCGCGCCFANGTVDPNWSWEQEPGDYTSDSNYTDGSSYPYGEDYDPSVDNPEWPGAFPNASSSSTIMFNSFSDSFPQELKCTWSKQTSQRVFQIVDESLPSFEYALDSWPVSLEPNSLYKFQVSDSFGDGAGVGWFTLTNNTASDRFEDGTLVWKILGDEFSYFADAYIWADLDGLSHLVDYVETTDTFLFSEIDAPNNYSESVSLLPPSLPQAVEVFPKVDHVNGSEVISNIFDAADRVAWQPPPKEDPGQGDTPFNQ